LQKKLDDAAFLPGKLGGSADLLPVFEKGWGCCKTSKKVSNSLFLLFEQNIGGVISHNRRKLWLVLHILKDIYPFAQTFRLRIAECFR